MHVDGFLASVVVPVNNKVPLEECSVEYCN